MIKINMLDLGKGENWLDWDYRQKKLASKLQRIRDKHQRIRLAKKLGQTKQSDRSSRRS